MKPSVEIPSRVEELAREAVDAALTVHRALGPGLLESAYAQCFAVELTHRGIPFERELALPIIYRGVPIDSAYRVDLILDRQLLLELKSVEAIAGIHQAQVITYLKLLHLPLGLLINFNVPLIKDGISRILNLSFRQPVQP